MQIVIAFLIHKAQNNATPNIFNSALSLFSGKKVKKKKMSLQMDTTTFA